MDVERAGQVSGWLQVLVAGSMVSAWLVLAGCQAPRRADDATEPNVIRVMVFYDPYTCWFRNEDKSRVTGIWVGGLYLIGPDGKGVFGDGVIRPKLYTFELTPEGKRVPKLVKEWSFDVEQADPFRAKEKRAYGWGYALPLMFGDLDLGGREVQLVISFDRSDGFPCTSGPKHLKVPKGAY
jgi:hypothetical protein